MPDEWWKWMANAIIGSQKFKDKGLDNEDLLIEMYDGLTNTGADHWCPSSGVPPSLQQHGDSDGDNQDEDPEGADDEDSESEEVTPTSVTGKRGRGKKPKTATGH